MRASVRGPWELSSDSVPKSVVVQGAASSRRGRGRPPGIRGSLVGRSLRDGFLADVEGPTEEIEQHVQQKPVKQPAHALGLLMRRSVGAPIHQLVTQQVASPGAQVCAESRRACLASHVRGSSPQSMATEC